MSKPMRRTIIGLIVVFGGIFGFYFLKQYGMHKYFSTFVPPPQTVSTVQAKNVLWQPYLTAVGTMSAINGVDISPEVSGQVKNIYFESGKMVKKNDPLIQLEDFSERAQLADVQAQLQLAEKNLERTKKLFSENVSTKSALDEATSKYKQLKANYENISSSISKKLVRAPFDGKIGIKQINVGQVVAAGQMCASLQAIHALYSKFSLPQQDIPKVFLKQVVKVSTDSYPDELFDGVISAIDSKVDDNTRTIEIQATVDNASGKLYPGMFVTLQLLLPSIPNTTVIPQTAITSTLYGDSAFIVSFTGKKDSNNQDLATVKRVFVRTGDKQENNVVILEGIKGDDIVVNSGQSKLENGASITINNSIPL